MESRTWLDNLADGQTIREEEGHVLFVITQQTEQQSAFRRHLTHMFLAVNLH